MYCTNCIWWYRYIWSNYINQLFKSCVMVIRRYQWCWRKQLNWCALLAVKWIERKCWWIDGWKWWWICEAIQVLLLLRLFSLALFLPLGASVLEPYLDLGFGEAEGWGNGIALKHGQVVAVLETMLQDPELVYGECCADSATFALRISIFAALRRDLPCTRTCVFWTGQCLIWEVWFLSWFISPVQHS